jgi:hypothetical protein
MANTPVYGIPYPVLGDSPNGPTQMQALALEVETELIRIDAAIAAINGLDVAFVGSTSDETFASSTFIPGTVVVGTSFVAPPSGKIMAHFGGHISSDVNTNAVLLSFEMKTGGTVGSGTLVSTAANGDRAIVCGRAVNSGAVAQLAAGNTALYTGLTPGATYNVRMMHAADPGNTSHAFYRQIMIVPVV